MITFRESDHTYWSVDGREFVAVTKICGITPRHPDFDHVDPEKVERAIKRGNAIHKEAENFFNLGEDGLLPTTEWLSLNIAPKYENFVAEEVVYNDNEVLPYAGTVDIIARKGNEVALMDIKTGGHETVDYQLSLYRRAFCKMHDIPEASVSLWLIDFKDEDKPRLSPVAPIADDWLDRLLECYAKGLPYAEPNIVPTGITDEVLANVEALENAIIEQKAYLENLEAQKKQMGELLVRAMTDAGVDSFATKRIKLALVKATTRKSFDTKAVEAFIKAHGENPDEYKKESPVGASVRVKVLA